MLVALDAREIGSTASATFASGADVVEYMANGAPGGAGAAQGGAPFQPVPSNLGAQQHQLLVAAAAQQQQQQQQGAGSPRHGLQQHLQQQQQQGFGPGAGASVGVAGGGQAWAYSGAHPGGGAALPPGSATNAGGGGPPSDVHAALARTRNAAVSHQGRAPSDTGVAGGAVGPGPGNSPLASRLVPGGPQPPPGQPQPQPRGVGALTPAMLLSATPHAMSGGGVGSDVVAGAPSPGRGGAGRLASGLQASTVYAALGSVTHQAYPSPPNTQGSANGALKALELGAGKFVTPPLSPLQHPQARGAAVPVSAAGNGGSGGGGAYP